MKHTFAHSAGRIAGDRGGIADRGVEESPADRSNTDRGASLNKSSAEEPPVTTLLPNSIEFVVAAKAPFGVEAPPNRRAPLLRGVPIPLWPYYTKEMETRFAITVHTTNMGTRGLQ